MEWGYSSLSPEQHDALKRMSRAMRDMHSALWTGHLRAFVFPFPRSIVPCAEGQSTPPEGPEGMYWLQCNWVGDVMETFTLDLTTLAVTVRSIEPYVFLALGEGQKGMIARGAIIPNELCDVFDITVSDVERYVSENIEYWEDRALSRPGLVD